MKKYFILLMMLLVIGFSVDASAQRHRHHQNVSINVNKDSSSVGITAYSDTTAEDSADVDTAQTYSYRNNVDDFQNTPNGFFRALANAGFTGGAIAFFVSLLCIIAILSPVLLIAVILYFIFRNRNQKYKLVEKAMAQGKTIPQELLTVDKQSFEYLWAKGIRNASIGLGLVCLFWILGAEEIIGVGLLVFFMGVGQAIIAKTTRKRGEEKSDDSNTQKPFDDSQFSADNGDDKIKDSDPING